MPRIIMNRAFIARWTRMPHSTGRLSASASSHHSLSSAAFITSIAESDFRYAQRAHLIVVGRIRRKNLPQVRLAEDQHPVHALATYGANQALRIRILPW